jgi:hypothetical protein
MLLYAPGCAQPIKWVELRCTAPRKTSSFSSPSTYTVIHEEACQSHDIFDGNLKPCRSDISLLGGRIFLSLGVLEPAWWKHMFLLVSRLSIRPFGRIVEDSRVCRLWCG